MLGDAVGLKDGNETFRVGDGLLCIVGSCGGGLGVNAAREMRVDGFREKDGLERYR